MEKELIALNKLASALGDLEINDEGLPICVVSGERGKNFKMVRDALADYIRLKEVITQLKKYLHLIEMENGELHIGFNDGESIEPSDDGYNIILEELRK